MKTLPCTKLQLAGLFWEREWASIVCISPFCDGKSIRDDEMPHLHCAARLCTVTMTVCTMADTANSAHDVVEDVFRPANFFPLTPNQDSLWH